MRDKGEVRQCRAGGDDLGAGDPDPGIGLLGHMRVDVGGAARRPGSHVAVDRRLDDRVIDKRHPLLAVAVPAQRIFLIGIVKFGIGAQCRKKGRLVIGRAPEPAIGQPRPLGDRITSAHQLFGRSRRHEIFVGEATPLGRTGQKIFCLLIIAVQRVVEPGDHPRGIAECGMLGDIFDPLAVYPHFSAIVEAVEKLLAGVGQRRGHAYALPCEAESACAARLLRCARNDNLRHHDAAEARRWHD